MSGDINSVKYVTRILCLYNVYGYAYVQQKSD